MIFSSLRRQLMVGFIGLAITPLLLAGLVSSSASFRAQEQQALAFQQALAQRFSSEIQLLIGQIESEMRQLTRVGDFNELDLVGQRERLSELIAYQDGLESVAILDMTGQELAMVDRMEFVAESEFINWAELPEFILPSTRAEVYYSDLITDSATDEPLMNLGFPLVDLRSGETKGVLIGAIRFKKVWDLLRDRSPANGESIYVIDERNHVVAHASSSVVLRPGGTIFPLPQGEGMNTGLEGEQVVMAWAAMPIGEQTLYVIAEQPVSEAMKLAYNTLWITVGLLAAALIVAGVSGALTVRQVVQPIETLAQTAQNIAAGDLTQRAQVKSASEIEALAESFNSMTTQLVTTLDGLETLNADLEKRVAARTAELQSANARLTQLDRLKTLFIQDMSHELRTPLSVMNTSVYLLEKKPERSAEYVQKLKDQIARLTQLASSTLELSRLEESGVNFEPLSLNSLVEQAAGTWRRQADAKGLSFDVQLHDQKMTISGDRDQLTQAIGHLLTNAINYTAAGGVEVTTNAEVGRAGLTIRDTGRGITPEDIPHLFERFYRGQGVGSSNISGSGLGLAIVKGIVDLHGGSIEVESTIDAGTTIRVWLPTVS